MEIVKCFVAQLKANLNNENLQGGYNKMRKKEY